MLLHAFASPEASEQNFVRKAQPPSSNSGIPELITTVYDFGEIQHCSLLAKDIHIYLLTIKVVKDTASYPFFMEEGISLFCMLEGSIYVKIPGSEDCIFHEGECNLFPVMGNGNWTFKLNRGSYQVLMLQPRSNILRKIKAYTPHIQRCVEYIESGCIGYGSDVAMVISKPARQLINRIVEALITAVCNEGHCGAWCAQLLLNYLSQVRLPMAGFEFDDVKDLPEKLRKEEARRKMEELEKAGKELSRFRVPAAWTALPQRGVYRFLKQKVRIPGFALDIRHFLVEGLAKEWLYKPHGTFSLFFMLHADAAVSIIRTEKIELNTGDYFIYYSDGIPDKVMLKKGRYNCLHIDVSSEFMQGLKAYLPNDIPVDSILHGIMANKTMGLSKLKFNSVVVRLLNKIQKCQYEERYARAFLRPVCIELFSHFLVQYEVERNPKDYSSVSSPGQYKALEFFLNEVIRLADSGLESGMIAKKYNIREDVLNRLFKQNFQTSLAEVILRTRMELAFQLMMWVDEVKNSDLVRIAKRCGYRSVKDFNRTFKEYYKCFPGEL